MKAIDYINTLIEEKEELKSLCKSHVETIRLNKKEMSKLNTAIAKKDKKILKLETDLLKINEKKQKELDKVKTELSNLKDNYKELKNKYDGVINENIELKRIFDEIEKDI